jgi:hypothetical protein
VKKILLASTAVVALLGVNSKAHAQTARGESTAVKQQSGDVVAAALGQAPTSLTGPCAAEVRLFFGVLQYGHTLHAECLYLASYNFLAAGYANTGAMLLEKAYNGGEQVYDSSLVNALQSDQERIAQSQVRVTTPSSSDLDTINNQLNQIIQQNRLIEQRLSVIHSYEPATTGKRSRR